MLTSTEDCSEKNQGNNMQELLEEQEQQPTSKTAERKAMDLVYTVDECPPWYACCFLGFQHYLAMIGGTIAIPVVLSVPMCFSDKPLVLSEVLNTIIFCSGLVTILQTTLGVRLPVLQGSTFSFLIPTIAILSLPKFQCLSTSRCKYFKVQGAIIVSAFFEIFIGFSGLIGVMLRFIGPLTVAPTITLIGLSLFKEASTTAGKHWGISMMTIAFIILYSYILSHIKIPLPAWDKSKGFHVAHYPCFKLFGIILAIFTSWAICAIITVAGGFPSNPSHPGYSARTDAKIHVLRQASWFRLPYPGQWGLPTVSAAGVFGMSAGVFASIIESVGDYYACARLSGAPPPPKHAVNRGIGVEGIGCLLTGLFGTGNGTTSYSSNIGAISITKVGSRRVLQYAGGVLVIMGILGKIGALFTTIPQPILGGLFMVMFGIVTAAGISNLQYVDLSSSRNLLVVGLAILFGLAVPAYVNAHPKAVDTGVREINQMITVLLSTGMAVGGMVALILDNIIPGTIQERGMDVWRKMTTHTDDSVDQVFMASTHIYDLPFGLSRLSKHKFSKYVPFLPYYPADGLSGEPEELPCLTKD